MTITPRKRRIVEALKPFLRHGPKTALVDAVDALLAEAEQATWETCAQEMCSYCRQDFPIRDGIWHVDKGAEHDPNARLIGCRAAALRAGRHQQAAE